MISPTARGAFRDLESKLRPFIARRVRSSSDVDDVLQDVFLRMQRGLHDLQDDQRFGPWVYQVARSAIGDHRRSAARHPLVAHEPDEDVVAEQSESRDEGDVAAAQAALVACIAPFVAELPTPYREAITLSELEGLTHQEAADMLGITLPAMKSRVQRGRLRLRAALDACCKIAVDARGGAMTCEPRKCS